jgi:hypothetical protein
MVKIIFLTFENLIFLKQIKNARFLQKTLVWNSGSQTVSRGTLVFHETSSDVPRICSKKDK